MEFGFWSLATKIVSQAIGAVESKGSQSQSAPLTMRGKMQKLEYASGFQSNYLQKTHEIKSRT